MSDTSTVISTEDAFSIPNVFASSNGSISSPRKSSSELSKAYKSASKFYLTRRFHEALSTIKPLVTIPSSHQNGEEDDAEDQKAPIAKADKKWRIKVWSFYLTLLNAVVELGPDEGGATIGRLQWKDILNKAETGNIWDEVVNVGYGGDESFVDAEVVVNLYDLWRYKYEISADPPLNRANLLLSLSESQSHNQERLETYLSTANSATSVPISRPRSQQRTNDLSSKSSNPSLGTDTPADLETRIQIIELYSLHVLPRNGEWDYARNFIGMSDVLDEERREAMIQTLSELEEEETGPREQFEDAWPHRQDSPIPVPKYSDIERIDSNVTIKADPSVHQRHIGGDEDFGTKIDESPAPTSELRPVPPQPTNEPISEPQRKVKPSVSSRPMRPGPGQPARNRPPNTILNRSMTWLLTLQKLVSNTALHISQNPAGLLRFVLFLVAVIAAFGRRDLRQRMRRLAGGGWDKVRQTVGMGVKVSYI